MSSEKADEKTTKKSEVLIEGMHCASCALNVEDSINKLDGVNAQVDINTNKASRIWSLKNKLKRH